MTPEKESIGVGILSARIAPINPRVVQHSTELWLLEFYAIDLLKLLDVNSAVRLLGLHWLLYLINQVHSSSTTPLFLQTIIRERQRLIGSFPLCRVLIVDTDENTWLTDPDITENKRDLILIESIKEHFPQAWKVLTSP